ncbi:hypothetical protein N7495_004337 [Penicillium taxi]|uniref:uncharacterized protein n=1 Tax=Penicillium taxi TaxID=168475 RepID=UPI0025453233|nr:uncharacterized protein N7495_004337 [Penicillium taxi]KAJ5899593.1 hypothetical protein N7495_004337 [Penicillium taxi]
MKLTTILSLATLALARPQSHVLRDKRDPLPYGDWVAPSSFETVPTPPNSTPTPSASPSTLPTPSALPAQNFGNAIVSNHCKFPVYLWSVGSTVRPVSLIGPDQNYAEQYRYDQPTGGIALKISTDANGLYDSAPQTVFAYNVNDQGKVWFDLTDVFGDAFKGYSVKLEPADPQIEWKDGVPPAEMSVRWIGASGDLVLHLCVA